MPLQATAATKPPEEAPSTLGLEGPLLTVPGDALKRSARHRSKVLNAELEAVVGQASQLPEDAAGRAAALEALEGRLQSLRRRFEAQSDEEAAAAAQMKERVAHLAGAGAPQRLDRLLADHLLRCGHVASGTALAHASGSTALVEVEFCAATERVVASLRARDAGPALEWCETHRAQLQKIESRLEVQLRLQVFVELVRSGDAEAAVRHARTQLAPTITSEHLPALQRAFALLVYREPGGGPPSPCHAPLLAASAWSSLAERFRADAARVHGLSRASALAQRLQAGLCALNVPYITRTEPGSTAQAAGDPLFEDAYRVLARGLPFSKQVHTRLVCPITGLVMDANNPPAALPDGHVYSAAALDELARAGGGWIACPRGTGAHYNASEVARVYIA